MKRLIICVAVALGAVFTCYAIPAQASNPHASLYRVSASVATPGNQDASTFTASVIAECHVGDVVTGGGFLVSGAITGHERMLRDSAPTADGGGWSAVMAYDTILNPEAYVGAEPVLTVYAICESGG